MGDPSVHAPHNADTHVANAVICYATADWDAELWTNKQHMMDRLATYGVPVVYVDSPGHRAPTASSRDLRRMTHRLALWRPTARSLRPGLWRDSPMLVPLYGRPSVVKLNEHLLRRRLRRNERRLLLQDPILWTYTPLGSQVFDRRRHAGLIYHCVDDVAAFPGVDAAHYRRAEAHLVERADVCIGSSLPLVHHLHNLGAKDVRYWPNPAETKAFTEASELIAGRRANHRPVIGFLGAVQEHKIDVELIRFCAEELPDVDFVVAGPIGLGLGRSTLQPESFPTNVRFPGSVHFEEAPSLVAGFDVGIIPYRLNQYTEGVFPMKVFEYLSAGLPVVSTALTSLLGEVDNVVFALDHAQFLQGLRQCLSGLPDVRAAQMRAQYASRFSWQNRIEEAIALLDEVRQRRLPQ